MQGENCGILFKIVQTSIKPKKSLGFLPSFLGYITQYCSKTNNFELNQNHTRRSSRLEFDRQMV